MVENLYSYNSIGLYLGTRLFIMLQASRYAMPQIQRNIQRVMMGDEGAGGGSTGVAFSTWGVS